MTGFAWDVTDADRAAYRRARRRYLEKHPEPQVTDFTCPRCHAQAGQRCTGRGMAGRPGHASRQDLCINARRRRYVAAANAADDAVTERMRARQ